MKVKSFLQTQDWLDFQGSVGHPGWRFSDTAITANIIRHDVTFGKNYLYIPQGPEISFDEISGGIKNNLTQFVTYLKKLAHEHKSFYVKMEPLDDKVVEMMHGFGFQKSKKSLQPARSVIVDLDRSDDQLLALMHHKTRYNIKVAEKSGIVIKASDEIETFWQLLEKTTKRDQFSSHTKEYYQQLLDFFGSQKNRAIKADLLLAYHADTAVAGAIILSMGEKAYYTHGASNYEYRQHMAPYALHWEIIKWLKHHNFRSYDLWGIDAVRWPGVTRFKLGWGGREIEYPGSFDLPISKFWYFLYKTFRR